MSEPTARPWTCVKSAAERGYKVRGGEHNRVILARYLSEEDAALIVHRVNAHDSLVEALEKARRDLRDYGAAPIQQVCEEMKRALDEAKP